MMLNLKIQLNTHTHVYLNTVYIDRPVKCMHLKKEHEEIEAY